MTDLELAEEIERALNVLQPLARSDTLFSAPNAAPGCELRFSTLRKVIAALRRGPEPSIAVNSPFERVPQHAGDPGFGPVPPESKVRNLVDVPEPDELSRHLEGEHHAIRAQEIDSPMNACSLKEICQWVKRIALQRPPSGEMVMVPREPTDAIVWAICEHSDAPIDRERCLRCPAKEPTYYGEGTRGCRALAEDQYRAMLSAAEAEGRKS